MKKRFDKTKKHLVPWQERPGCPPYRPYAPPAQRVVYVPGEVTHRVTLTLFAGTKAETTVTREVRRLVRKELWSLSERTASGRAVRRQGAAL